MMDDLCAYFNGIQIVEQHNYYYRFKVSQDQLTMGFLFGKLEDLKEMCDITDYSVSQTTLEQIFNMFAQKNEMRNYD